MKKILVLPMYGIGDVLMTTPALRNLKEQLDVKITYLHMFTTTRDILLHNPYIDENIHFPFLETSKFSGLRFLMGLRKRFDCSINFYPSNRRQYNLAAFIAGSPVRIGHRYLLNNIKEMNFLKTSTVMEDDSLHCVEENLRLLSLVGIQVRMPYPLELYLTEEERLFAAEWLKERKIDEKILVGIHLGTSVFKNHDKKRWPQPSFAGLIDRLSIELKDAAFLLFGGTEERPLRDAISSMVHYREKVFSVDSASIRQTTSLMKNCSLFISNDSGLMHMASALGVPTVAIFGPTNPVWVRPWGVKHRVIRLGLSCSPCFRYSPRPLRCVANRDYACVKDISVDSVFDACIELIKETTI